MFSVFEEIRTTLETSYRQIVIGRFLMSSQNSTFNRGDSAQTLGVVSDDRPKVFDLTGARRAISVESDGSSFYDLILTVWSAFGDEDTTSFELGSKWFAEVRSSTPADLAEEIEFLGGEGAHSWMALMGLVATAPHPHDIGAALAWLGRVDPVRLRWCLLDYTCAAKGADPALIERAARSDESALAELFPAESGEGEHFRRILALAQEDLRSRIVEALSRFRAEVYGRYEKEFSQATSRAAAAQRALARENDPHKIIEAVTNGLDYRIPPGVAHVVLVPSVVLRPWAVIDRIGELLFVAYPVADEFIDADPDAPPSWVVKLHKALGDERRLRILRRVAQEPTGLDELSEMLGLTKSTVHHHVGLLRAAGLVRVQVGDDAPAKGLYTLRPTVLAEARKTLDHYLRTDSDLESVNTQRSEA